MTDTQEIQSAEKTAEDIGKEMLVMMESLTTIMQRETEALKNKNMDEVKDFSRDKVNLLREYQKTLVVVANNPSMLKNIDADLKEKLRAVRVVCEKVAKKNHTSLKGALNATQSLVETIVKAAVKSAQKTDSYSDPRMKHLKLGTYNPVCDPVALCRTV